MTNLVSDQPGVALIQDPNLVNPWGIALNPAGGPFWVSDNGTGKSTLYSGDVSGGTFAKAALVVTIPGGSPTGQVFNSSTDFKIPEGAPVASSRFIFASQTGNITGWNPAVPPATSAHLGTSVEDAVYTGLAIGKVGTANFLYAANFLNRTIDVFDKDFNLVHLAGSFSDPTLPNSYAPFNVQNLGGKLYVTYAQLNHKAPDEETDHGSGFVDVFDTNGNLVQRLIRGNHLKAPWGVALAPSDFGPFSNTLLVGNFGNGRINAFDPSTGKFLGQLQDEAGKPIVLDGLWGITFGNGRTAGDSNALYFAAGPEGETHGLFGSVRFVAGSASLTGASQAIGVVSAGPAAATQRTVTVVAPSAANGNPAVTGVPPRSPSTPGPSQASPFAAALTQVNDPGVLAALDALFAADPFHQKGSRRDGLG